MPQPHRVIKRIEFTEEEWLKVYTAAKAAGLAPMEFLKMATLNAVKTS
jgi:hypothetical protein